LDGDAGAAEVDETTQVPCPDEGLLAHLALVSPDLLCAVAPDGVFLAVNAAWERLLGWTPEELVGRPFPEFLEDEYRERTWAAWTGRVLRGETVIDFENRFPCKDGSARWISWSATLDEETSIVYCSGRDISDRVERFVELAHEAKLLAEAERVAGIGVWDWQVDEDVGYLSAGLCAIYGTAIGEPTTLPQLLEVIAPEDRGWYEARLQEAVSQGTEFEAEYRVVRPDGRDAIVWERGFPVVTDGRTIRMYGTVKDITDRRRAERDLRQAAERERRTVEQLRRIDQVKTSFLSAISHELRTPLAVISGVAETLQLAGESIDPDRRRSLQDALVRNTQRFTTLLTDLLDVDRRSRGTLPVELETVDVATLARDAVSRAADPGRIEVDAPPTLLARVDPVQTERIITNLLDNADKYAPEGTVTLTLDRLGEAGIRLEVRDRGPGIDPEDLARVFDPFYRAEGGAEQPGTGIGLALVDAFVSLQGGRVWAEPCAPHGTSFVVELPDPAAMPDTAPDHG
jgi:PAS domain S-box-containing protein